MFVGFTFRHWSAFISLLTGCVRVNRAKYICQKLPFHMLRYLVFQLLSLAIALTLEKNCHGAVMFFSARLYPFSLSCPSKAKLECLLLSLAVLGIADHFRARKRSATIEKSPGTRFLKLCMEAFQPQKMRTEGLSTEIRLLLAFTA